MTDAEALAAIHIGNPEGLQVLYLRYREKCINYIRRHLHDDKLPEDAADLYQDAILILHNNVKNGRLERLWAQTDTYLIAIIRRQWQRKQKRTSRPLLVPPEAVEEEEHPDLLRQRLRRALGKMEDKCRAMVTLRHFDQLGYDVIAELLEYKNGSTVRNLIARCREKLRQLFESEPELPYQVQEDQQIASLDGITEEE
ncbi:MAG: RNA polymerase sigma factor [Bacteroidota bacterium]